MRTQRSLHYIPSDALAAIWRTAVLRGAEADLQLADGRLIQFPASRRGRQILLLARNYGAQSTRPSDRLPVDAQPHLLVYVSLRPGGNLDVATVRA